MNKYEKETHDKDNETSNVHKPFIFKEVFKGFHVVFCVEENSKTDNGKHHAHNFGEKQC